MEHLHATYNIGPTNQKDSLGRLIFNALKKIEEQAEMKTFAQLGKTLI